MKLIPSYIISILSYFQLFPFIICLLFLLVFNYFNIRTHYHQSKNPHLYILFHSFSYAFQTVTHLFPVNPPYQQFPHCRFFSFGFLCTEYASASSYVPKYIGSSIACSPFPVAGHCPTI